MNKNYWLIFVAVVALLAYLKYDYDKRNKEKQRVEQLNQQISDGAASMSNQASKDFNNGYGESLIDGLKEIDISSDSK